MKQVQLDRLRRKHPDATGGENLAMWAWETYAGGDDTDERWLRWACEKLRTETPEHARAEPQ